MNGPAPQRFATLDVLRGILALGVAVYHLSVWFGLTPAGSLANMALAKAGNYSVSAFFVLTGFLLARTAAWPSIARQGLWTWTKKRMLRLAPLFWLAVLVNLLFRLGMGPEPKLRFILENVTLTFGLFHPNHALVTGGWYVGVAVLAYVAWPAVAWLMARVGAWTLFLLAGALLAWSLGPTLHDVMAADPWNRFHAYVMPGNQLFLVAIGALVGWLHARFEQRLGHVLFLLGVFVALWMLFRPFPWFGDHLAALTGPLRYRYIACVTALVALCAFHKGVESKWLQPFLLLGGWSYGIYLAHPFLQRVVAPHVGGWTGLALALAGSILVAAAAERWVERPLSWFA
jgi:exopolysaccharide production protein ExoZ